MKKTDSAYVLISFILGIVNGIPLYDISNNDNLIYLIFHGFGFLLGSIIISASITLIISIFSKSTRKNFRSTLFLTTMLFAIIGTIGQYLITYASI